jgi:alpha-D-xyloside xylohydrolase
MIHYTKKTAIINILSLFVAFLILCCNPANARIKSVRKDANGITCYLDQGLMKIKLCSADLVQVKYTMLDAFPVWKSLVVNNTFTAKVNFTVSTVGQHIFIKTNKLTVRIDKATDAITYLTADNKVITSETVIDGKRMQAAN